MRPDDGQVEVFRQQSSGTHMVKMAMRQQDFFESDARILNQCAQTIKFTARIDDDCPLRLITP